jgi:hypothetical protein
MQITLKQAELELAVRDYIQTVGISGNIGEVNFTPTRGTEGIVTSIEVGEASPINCDVTAEATVSKAETKLTPDTSLDTEEDGESTRLFG